MRIEKYSDLLEDKLKVISFFSNNSTVIGHYMTSLSHIILALEACGKNHRF